MNQPTRGKWEALGVEVWACNARIADCEPYETKKSTETCKSNARLCAAAPAMLEHLIKAVAEWPEFDNDRPILGSDLVDWFSTFREKAFKIVQEARGLS